MRIPAELDAPETVPPLGRMTGCTSAVGPSDLHATIIEHIFECVRR
jgi:hypothetical protein